MSPNDDLLARLGSQDRAVQRVACDEVAARLRSDPSLRPELLELLHGGSRLARFAVAFVLFNAERPTLRLLPALLDALEIGDGDVRWQAAHMLATLGRISGEVLPVLLHEAANASSALRRRMALFALRELAPEREETGAAFLHALEDPDPDVRRAALSCFAKLSDPGRETLDRVLEVARAHPDPRMTRIAAIVLAELVRHHPDARAEVMAFIESLRGSADAGLARAAAAASNRLAREAADRA